MEDLSFVSRKKALWKQFADDHIEKQLINPFANWEGVKYRASLSKDDPNYGKPVEGSKTEYRGKQAHKHISNEVIELCHVIAYHGQQQPNGTYTVTFGVLFQAYITISNKLVGMLMRARKHSLLDFEGEMLYQGRDEKIVITLFVLPERSTSRV